MVNLVNVTFEDLFSIAPTLTKIEFGNPEKRLEQRNEQRKKKDKSFKRFQSQGQGHKNEYVCQLPCMSTLMRSLNATA